MNESTSQLNNNEDFVEGEDSMADIVRNRSIEDIILKNGAVYFFRINSLKVIFLFF